MADSADEGVKRGSCPCIFSSDHPLCRLKVQRSGRHLIRTGPQLEIPLSLTISSFLIVAIHSNSILTLTMPLIPNDEEISESFSSAATARYLTDTRPPPHPGAL